VKGDFRFPVEAGHILQFARAIGDPNPVYRDAAHARHAGFADVLAPPTFVQAADHLDPAYTRRPDLGSEGVLGASGQHDALLHVSQHFAYRRHPAAGETLLVRRRTPRRWTTTGRRGGHLEFVELVTDYVDETGVAAVTTTWTDVRSERGHRALSVAPESAPEIEPEPERKHDTEFGGAVVVRDLTRTQIVMYVGASGDYHPLHHDDDYAHRAGYPGVFAPGMLTMAMSARAVTDIVGDGVLEAVGGRLTRQVWPGDTLRVRVEPAGEEGRDFGVITVNQHGATVFDGLARTAEVHP